MATYKILGTTVGVDSGPYTIYSNTGAILATGITRAQILAGYVINVPAGVTSIELRSTGSCTNSAFFTITSEGFWEMQTGAGVEKIGDHYYTISAAYTAPCSSFVSKDIVGIYSGSVTGAGLWTIKGGPEPIAGTTYTGGGLLILTNNTNSPTGGTTIQSGAKVQLGYSTESYTGTLQYTTTLQTGSTLDIFGTNSYASPRSVLQGTTNAGTINVKGSGGCAEGVFQLNGVLGNTGTINIDDSELRLVQTINAVTGIINVADGGTLGIGAISMPNTQTININGCGLCMGGTPSLGAIHITADATPAFAGIINMQSDSCIGFDAGADVTFSGKLDGNKNLKLHSITGVNNGATATFSNNANTYNGTLTVENMGLYNPTTTALQFAKIVLAKKANIQAGSNITIGSLSSTIDDTNSFTTDGRTITIANNGITTYNGGFPNSTPGTIGTINLQGGSANELTLTKGGAAYNFNVNGGARLLLPSGTWGDSTWGGIMNVNAGSTISGGDGNLGTVRTLNMISSKLEVNYPISAGGVSKLFTTFFNVTTGYTVDIPDSMPAGTYTILENTNGGTGVGVLPTLGINNTGKTATFSWTAVAPRKLILTLA